MLYWFDFVEDTFAFLLLYVVDFLLKVKESATEDSLSNNKPIIINLQEIVEILNLGNADMDNRLIYLKSKEIIKIRN